MPVSRHYGLRYVVDLAIKKESIPNSDAVSDTKIQLSKEYELVRRIFLHPVLSTGINLLIPLSWTHALLLLCLCSPSPLLLLCFSTPEFAAFLFRFEWRWHWDPKAVNGVRRRSLNAGNTKFPYFRAFVSLRQIMI